MRIGYRLTLLLAGPLMVLMALFGYLDDRRTRERNREELAREGRSVARTLQLAIEDYFRDRQLEDVRDLGDQVTNYERILGLRVFNADGTIIYESASLASYPFLSRPQLLAVLSEGRSFELQRKLGDEPATSFLLPLSGAAGRRLGALQLLQLGAFIEEEARASRNFMILLTVATIVALTGIVYLVTLFGVSRPTEELVRRFRQAGAGDLQTRAPVRGHDELGRLAQEFNAMCARLDEAQRSLQLEQEKRHSAETALRTAERLASVGELAAGLAHEIGTPLNVISGRAEGMLSKAPPDSDLRRGLGIIVAQIERISRIVHGMLDFARTREMRPRPVDAARLIATVLEFMEHRLERYRIRVGASLPDGLPRVSADPDQLSQVFLNLVVNAVEAMPEGGTLEVRATVVSRTHHDHPDAVDRPYLALVFADSGVGIAPEHLPRVFDPFFTTKDVGAGVGLGLSVSYGIVQEHGGWIEIESAPGKGTGVTVYLPVVETGPAATGESR